MKCSLLLLFISCQLISKDFYLTNRTDSQLKVALIDDFVTDKYYDEVIGEITPGETVILNTDDCKLFGLQVSNDTIFARTDLVSHRIDTIYVIQDPWFKFKFKFNNTPTIKKIRKSLNILRIDFFEMGINGIDNYTDSIKTEFEKTLLCDNHMLNHIINVNRELRKLEYIENNYGSNKTELINIVTYLESENLSDLFGLKSYSLNRLYSKIYKHIIKSDLSFNLDSIFVDKLFEYHLYDKILTDIRKHKMNINIYNGLVSELNEDIKPIFDDLFLKPTLMLSGKREALDYISEATKIEQSNFDSTQILIIWGSECQPCIANISNYKKLEKDSNCTWLALEFNDDKNWKNICKKYDLKNNQFVNIGRGSNKVTDAKLMINRIPLLIKFDE